MARDLLGQDALEGLVRAGDRRQFRFGQQTYKDVLREAGSLIRSGALNFDNFNTTVIKNKTCVSYAKYDVHLSLRAITKYLRRRYKLAPPSRDMVVRGLIEAFLDATPTHIVRRDIRSFYETIPVKTIREHLLGDPAAPPMVRSYLAKFFDIHCPSADHVGIPRGTAISPLLADIAMQEFDAAIRSASGVFRYYRFSDDIIALTTSNPEQLSALMDSTLPKPMAFHRNAKKRVDAELPGKGGDPPAVQLEYLGYRFDMKQTKEKRDSRELRVAFSGRKIRKLQSRIIVASLAHKKKPDWSLFLDRISFLTSNHRVLRGHVVAAKDSPYIMAGLYYNYRACGRYTVVGGKLKAEAYDLRELKQLDGFYFSVLRRMTLAGAPPPAVALALRRRSFARGYELKIHQRIVADEIAIVQKCWRHI